MIQHTLLMLAVKLAVKFNGGIYICFVYMVSRSLVPRRSLWITFAMMLASFSYSGIVLWNRLPLEMQHLTSFNVFKGKYLKT